MENETKIAIVGSGAMGTLFAGMLARAGHCVWLLERDENIVRAVLHNGIIIEEDDGDDHIPCNNITSDPLDIGTAELILFFVKACDTADAVRSLPPMLSDGTTVLTLQNGLGNVDIIAEAVPEANILAGTTSHGAYLVAPGRVRHAGKGDTVIGAVVPESGKRAVRVQHVFEQAGITVLKSDAVISVLWSKLLVNAAINPLTALLAVRNGVIAENDSLKQVCATIVNEIVKVAKKMGIPIMFSDPYAKVMEVATATATNVSSMLQDVEHGRRTEIDFINGAVVRSGERIGVPTPYNRIMTTLIKARETPEFTGGADDKNV